MNDYWKYIELTSRILTREEFDMGKPGHDEPIDQPSSPYLKKVGKYLDKWKKKFGILVKASSPSTKRKSHWSGGVTVRKFDQDPTGGDETIESPRVVDLLSRKERAIKTSEKSKKSVRKLG